MDDSSVHAYMELHGLRLVIRALGALLRIAKIADFAGRAPFSVVMMYASFEEVIFVRNAVANQVV